MRARTLLCASLLALAPALAAAQDARPPADGRPWSVRMTESVMRRSPVVHERWDYVAGLMLQAVWEVGERTGDPRYAAYVRANMERLVQPDGTIRTYRIDEFNIDQVAQGNLLFPLHERTGDPRWRRAAETLREQLRRHPRTREGGFWHKQIYPHQMWLDGLYMGSPFYARYGRAFGEPAAFDDVARQVLLMTRHTRDPRTGLLLHGWDESRSQIWADTATGLSPHVWGRAMGWYLMALVDILDVLPADHAQRGEIVRALRDGADAVARVQDPVTGLWYDVMDQPNRAGNYHEASASSMFAYAFAKGHRQGHLDPSFRRHAERAFDGIVRDFVTVDADGTVSLHRIVQVSGLGGAQRRDGSYAYYISEPIVSNDYKGVGPFVLAALELGR